LRIVLDLRETARLRPFHALLLAFALHMLGIVLAENLFLLLVFGEIMSLTSLLLIAYKYEARDPRIAAPTPLVVPGGGRRALLAGLLFIGHRPVPALTRRSTLLVTRPDDGKRARTEGTREPRGTSDLASSAIIFCVCVHRVPRWSAARIRGNGASDLANPS
jgi:hypothetical protein